MTTEQTDQATSKAPAIQIEWKRVYDNVTYKTTAMIDQKDYDEFISLAFGEANDGLPHRNGLMRVGATNTLHIGRFVKLLSIVNAFNELYAAHLVACNAIPDEGRI